MARNVIHILRKCSKLKPELSALACILFWSWASNSCVILLMHPCEASTSTAVAVGVGVETSHHENKRQLAVIAMARKGFS